MTAFSDETGGEALESPQHIVEGIILRRLHDKRIEGYTLEMSKEIAAALSASPVAAWKCAALKQSFPEPADCGWPTCGCDPHADKVIAALEEQGHASPVAQEPVALDLETIQTLLDLLNPLHGSLDQQTYDEKLRENFDAPRDYEHHVTVTWGQEGDLTQAVRILEDRKKNATPPATPAGLGADEIARHGIYIASKTKHADRWRFLRDKVGEPIISTWIDEAGEGESSDLHDLWRRCLTEASSCQVLIAYREKDEVLKGGWVEIGAALSSGIPVYAVGLEEFTIAKYRGITHFPDMKSAIAASRTILALLSRGSGSDQAKPHEA